MSYHYSYLKKLTCINMDLPSVHSYANFKKITKRNQEIENIQQEKCFTSKDLIQQMFFLPEKDNNMDLPSVHSYANFKKITKKNQEIENIHQEKSFTSKDLIQQIFFLPERDNNMKFKYDTELSIVHTYGICNTGFKGNQYIFRQEIHNPKDQNKPPIFFLLSDSQNKIQTEMDKGIAGTHHRQEKLAKMMSTR